MNDVIKTINLTKTYGSKKVVSGVSMNVKKGEIYGFLGPNGAGKTTIIKMLTNLIKPTDGDIEIFGERIDEKSNDILKRIGSIIETPVFYEKLTAKENIELHLEYMGCHDRDAAERALNMVNLKNTGRKKVSEFSLGMKQRLGIARTISTRPELMLLDEPINGLDPIGIKEFRDLFKLLSKEYSTTILISSHILNEIEQMADTIGVINNGVLLEQVSMDSIRGKNTEYTEITIDNCNKAAYIMSNDLNTDNFKVIDGNTIRIYDSKLNQNEISKALILNGVGIESITRKNGSLEDHFIEILKRGERVA